MLEMLRINKSIIWCIGWSTSLASNEQILELEFHMCYIFHLTARTFLFLYYTKDGLVRIRMCRKALRLPACLGRCHGSSLHKIDCPYPWKSNLALASYFCFIYS